jgi:hypothetical protein
MKLLNIEQKSEQALEWLEKRSGVPSEKIKTTDRSYAEMMHLKHLHRAVLCEEFRKGQVKRFLEIGGNSLNNSLKYHKKQLESKVYQIIYQQLKDYVYSN